MSRALSACLLFAVASCKVPFSDVGAAFTLADATWFEEEQTLFFFYRVTAEQGIGDDTSIEVSWRTDDEVQEWVELQTLPQVHGHVPVDCGYPKAMCGGGSVHVEKVPRDVAVRLRYHRQGELFLDPRPVFNVVGVGPAHTNRSLLVYGVFDATNTRVQWRARHNFPTLRNEEVQQLGLRRVFQVLEPAYGDVALPMENPYGYGFDAACPPLAPLGWAEATTDERAVFAAETLPLAASTAPVVCGRSVVTDALGTFERPAVARKNPETRPAFPLLRSPIRDNLQLGFVLRPCRRDISAEHLAMQVQRLQLHGAPEVCIDDIADTGFADTLAGAFRARIEAERPKGRDMVLVIALHHDDEKGSTRDVLEDALEQVLPAERDKTSPRVSGAFVLDSYAHRLGRVANKRVVLWCPAALPPMVPENDLDLIPDAAQRSCPIVPIIPDINLGPFSFGTLPILPSRAQYLTFISKYSEGQAGNTTQLTFLAPERTPVSQNLPLGEFGVATFFNHESISAEPHHAFSFCQGTELVPAVFRVPAFPDMPGPLQVLPEIHTAFPQPTYELGLGWDFPFFTKLDYQVTVAGAVSPFSVSVPFGISGEGMQELGLKVWETGEFPLDKLLTQCTRFCEHPTFDGFGVYNVQVTFRGGFGMACYAPKFPVPGSGGFPSDP